MKSMFSVILAFSLPLAIFANVINEKECDVNKGEIYLSGAPQSRTFEACKQACQDEAACQSITFYDSSGSCSLFSTKCENTTPMIDAHSELVKELGGLFGLECDNSQGELWLDNSKEADLAGCKKTCMGEPKCQSVTFYHSGDCSLFSTRCEKTKASPGAQSALVKELSGKIGQACDTSQGEIYLTGDHEADFAECKKSCEDDAHCHSVTYFHDGYCSLFATACDKTTANPAAQSALVKEIKHSQEQCEIDGTCHHGEECDRSKGEEYMADGSGEKSYEECKQACMDRAQCQSITYFVHGVCSLFKTQCQNRKPCKDAVARTLKADFFNAQECDGDKGEIFLSASSGNQADLEACRQSCEDAADCKSTTFFKSGYCSHYSTCCKNRKPSANGNADAVKTATCIDACVIENGGCDSKRACTSTDGVATCGDCPAPFVNDGAKDCKKPAPADPCKTNNGGCDSKRKCTSTGGVATCGDCPGGFTNDGSKGCKANPKPTPAPETNPCKTPGCQRAPAFDGKKCPEFKNGKKHPDRCFKETGKTVDECAAICSKDAACNFFSHPKEASGWCIGCKVAPSVKHPGAMSYAQAPNPCKTPGCQRAPAFDGKKCPEFKNGKKHPDRCFKETGKTVDECAAICSKDAACNFFSHPKEASGWCIGCKVAPSEKHPGAMSYAQTTTVADPCKTNNGGCDAKRPCTSTGGVVTCGDCRYTTKKHLHYPAGHLSCPLINDGAKGCKTFPKKASNTNCFNPQYPDFNGYDRKFFNDVLFAAGKGYIGNLISAEECQALCELCVPGCAYFTRFSNGGCHVHSSKAKEDTTHLEKHLLNPKGTLSGPAICSKKVADPCKKNNGGCHSFRRCMSRAGKVTCGGCAGGLVQDGAKGCKAKPKPTPAAPAKPKPTPAAPAKPKPTPPKKAQAKPKPTPPKKAQVFCHKANTQYAPKDDIPGEGRTTMSADQCQARCRSVPACAYYSRWNNGGCHLSSSKAKRVASPDSVSGPRSCEKQEEKKCFAVYGEGIAGPNAIYFQEAKIGGSPTVEGCAAAVRSRKDCAKDYFSYLNLPGNDKPCICKPKEGLEVEKCNTPGSAKYCPHYYKFVRCGSVFAPKSLNELYNAVVACMAASDFACTKGPHGPIGSWDVSAVTNMGNLFGESGTAASPHKFNGDISHWDVSKVTNMEYMFQKNKSFKGDITMWDVRNVKHMGHMFIGATSFHHTLCCKWKEVLDSGKCNSLAMFRDSPGRICIKAGSPGRCKI